MTIRPVYCKTLADLLARQAYRELAAAHLFSTGVRLAPTLDEKQMFGRQSLDELEHFETVASVYEELTGDSPIDGASRRVERLPQPRSWPEMAVVAFLHDRAAYFQLCAYRSSTDERVASLAARVLADEKDHLSASESTLVDLCRDNPSVIGTVQEHVDRWLPIALGSFDDGPAPSSCCQRAPHSNSAATTRARSDYAESIAPAFRACRLRPPSSLGRQSPGHVDDQRH